jgi:hypothetical protein
MPMVLVVPSRLNSGRPIRPAQHLRMAIEDGINMV